MSEPELRAALRARAAEQRFAAVYVVGEKRLNWHKDLIPLLSDDSEAVRQAARRSLIILSFLARNPAEATLITSPARSRPPTPLARLNPPVDFGPLPSTPLRARAEAARRWTGWWTQWEAQATPVSPPGLRDIPPDRQAEGEALATVLLRADPRHQREQIEKYRDAKGVQYTEALALAIPRSTGDSKHRMREALARRLSRMTERTLRRYLDDDWPEIRRGAVLALGMRDSKEHSGRIIDLLLDPEPLVERAAYAVLKELSGKDFGPPIHATDEEKNQAVARWREWFRMMKLAVPSEVHR